MYITYIYINIYIYIYIYNNNNNMLYILRIYMGNKWAN